MNGSNPALHFGISQSNCGRHLSDDRSSRKDTGCQKLRICQSYRYRSPCNSGNAVKRGPWLQLGGRDCYRTGCLSDRRNRIDCGGFFVRRINDKITTRGSLEPRCTRNRAVVVQSGVRCRDRVQWGTTCASGALGKRSPVDG